MTEITPLFGAKSRYQADWWVGSSCCNETALFADTKTAENLAQEIIGAEFAGDLA